jgi:hypothetical protein
MLNSMTVREFHEWNTFLAIEPSGERMMDWRFAQLCALIANCLGRAKNQAPYKLEQFMPDLRSEEARKAFEEASKHFEAARRAAKERLRNGEDVA